MTARAGLYKEAVEQPRVHVSEFEFTAITSSSLQERNITFAVAPYFGETVDQADDRCGFYPTKPAIDDQIDIGKIVDGVRLADMLQRLVHIIFGDLPRSGLPGHIAVDRRQRPIDALGVDVIHNHIEARQGSHMGDAIAHLPGTDNTHFLDTHNV